jgi:hypothetical protein
MKAEATSAHLSFSLLKSPDSGVKTIYKDHNELHANAAGHHHSNVILYLPDYMQVLDSVEREGESGGVADLCL